MSNETADEEMTPAERLLLTETRLGLVVQFMLNMLPVAALKEALAYRRQQDTLQPLLDPTRYRREMQALAHTQAILEAALAFRQRLAELRAKE